MYSLICKVVIVNVLVIMPSSRLILSLVAFVLRKGTFLILFLFFGVSSETDRLVSIGRIQLTVIIYIIAVPGKHHETNTRMTDCVLFLKLCLQNIHGHLIFLSECTTFTTT